jgi:putative transposase
MTMTYYARNLPHWHPPGRAIFLTWRLHDSLPRAFLERLVWLKNKPGQQFLEADKKLDAARSGPMWLARPEIAECVVKALHRGEEELCQYGLNAFVVMANHVHILIEPRLPLARITNGIKGVSARQANRILGRAGLPFWQDESFDHWVRSPGGWERAVRYIEQNPVKAGLVERAEEWPWSSAHK